MTQTRTNVEGLLRFIGKDEDLLVVGVMADKLVGQGKRELGMTDTEQEEAIRRFKEGKDVLTKRCNQFIHVSPGIGHPKDPLLTSYTSVAH